MVIGRQRVCTVVVCAVASSGNFSPPVLSVAVFISVSFPFLPFHILR